MKKLLIILLPILMVFTSCIENTSRIRNDIYNDNLKVVLWMYDMDDMDDLLIYFKEKPDKCKNVTYYNNRVHFTYTTNIDLAYIGYDPIQFDENFENLNITLHIEAKTNLWYSKLKLTNLIVIKDSIHILDEDGLKTICVKNSLKDLEKIIVRHALKDLEIIK